MKSKHFGRYWILLYRHEELQGIYLRLGYYENKKAIVEEAEGLEKEVINVIEKQNG